MRSELTLVYAKVVGTVLLSAGIAACVFTALDRQFNTHAIDGGFIAVEIVESAAPSVSLSGRSVFYADSTAHNVQVSSNGGAFSALSTAANSCLLSGCTMTGSTTYSGVSVDITSVSNQDIVIDAHGTGVVQVGTTFNEPIKFLTTTGSVTLQGSNPNELYIIGFATTSQGYQVGGIEVAMWSPGYNGVFCISASKACGLRQSQSAVVTTFLGGYADAAGEVASRVGSTRTDAEGGDDSTLLAVVTDEDGTPVNKFAVQGSGHLTASGVTPSSYTSGTCTDEVGTGDDTAGTITATCTAQTAIVTFGAAFTAAPICVVSAMNAAASAGAATLTYTTSTTALTLTVTPATTAGQWAFTCIE